MAPAGTQVLAMGSYGWLVPMGALGAFIFGYGTGANDVANAFGTSVGAKTLTLRTAVVLAIIFEFTGALVLGRVSTDTIAGGIAQIYAFQREPEFYAYGMMLSLWIGGVWQILASYYEMNVSATHSIIGCIIGFTMTYRGAKAVKWADPVIQDAACKTGAKLGCTFPPYKGVVPIVLSWFVSPVLTGIASTVIFNLCRFLILRRENAYKLSFIVLPIMVMLTMWVNIYFVFTKGAKKMLTSDADAEWTDVKAGWIAAAVAGGFSFLSAVVVVPIMYWRINTIFTERDQKKAAEEEATQREKEAAETAVSIGDAENADAAEKGAVAAPANEKGASEKAIIDSAPAAEEAAPQNKYLAMFKKAKDAAMHGMTVDIHDCVEEDPVVAAIHANAEVFDEKAEFVFSYLQVFSAICVIFAHGAGEVGYMAGPLGAIWAICKNGVLPSKIVNPVWIILIGAFGLVFGLATYGYNVTRAVGTKLAKLSPSRGFAAELSTSLIIMVAAQYGLPTSSSQCITGGIIGIALAEGKKGLNWKFFAETFSSWIFTVVGMALITSFFFAQGVYAPSKQMGYQIIQYEETLTQISYEAFKNFNSALSNSYGFYNASSSMNPSLYNSVAAMQSAVPPIWPLPANGKSPKDAAQNVAASTILASLGAALALYQNYTVFNYAALCPMGATTYTWTNATTTMTVGCASGATSTVKPKLTSKYAGSSLPSKGGVAAAKPPPPMMPPPAPSR